MRYFLIGAALMLSCCNGNDDETGADIKSEKVYSGTAMVMIDSARTLAPGSDILLDSAFELQNGRDVDFHLADGASVTLRGPVSGKLGALLETDTHVERWVNISTDMLNKSANENHVLTVRSGGNEGVVWLPFAVPVPFSGNFCIPAEASLKLYRPGLSNGTLNFNLTDGDYTVPLEIGAGENTEIEWPESLLLDKEIEFKNPAWFEKHTFRVLRLASADKVSLAKAGCSYHLQKMKHLAR